MIGRSDKGRESCSPLFFGFPARFFWTISAWWNHLLFLILLCSCNGGAVDHLFQRSSPYEKYLSSLESASLSNYALVKDWKRAGAEALTDSLQIELPYQEVGFFDRNRPEAMLWRFAVEEGNRIHVSIESVSEPSGHLFVEIFETGTVDQKLKKLHFADSSGNLTYEVRQSGVHAIRLQPELFRGGVFSLSIVAEGLLEFPIPGKSTKDISSFWGNARDGNTRKHEGIDVFARRGTPVLAASAGRVTEVGENKLGGNVVWLSSREWGHSQYYAHLDTQLVEMGQEVRAGDTLGLVGNTGNAKTTAPHLHFGIYKRVKGAVNPVHFLKELVLPQETLTSDTVFLGAPALIKVPLANIRSSPDVSSAKTRSDKKDTLLRILGKSGRWYRVSFPDQSKGFIFENLVEKTTAPIGEIELGPLDELRETWDADVMVSGRLLEGKAHVLGKFEGHYFLRTASGIQGWWRTKP